MAREPRGPGKGYLEGKVDWKSRTIFEVTATKMLWTGTEISPERYRLPELMPPIAIPDAEHPSA